MATNSSAQESKSPQKKGLKLAGLSSLIGMGGTLAVYPILHPLDVLKANWQTNPHLKHELAVGRMIKNTKGIAGFYSGILTNCTKQVCKSAYRYPLISGLPRFYSRLFDLDLDKHKYKLKMMTSLSVTSVEASIITPFERLQVFIMTSQNTKSNYSDFLKTIKGNVRKELFKGFTPYFARQIVAWTSLLLSDAFFKSKVRKYWQIPKDEMITGYKLLLCTFSVTCTTILVAMPFDNIKTYIQKNMKEIRAEGKHTKADTGKIGIKKAISRIYNKGGVLGFFVGWRLKMSTYFITTSLAVTVIEWLDNLHNKAEK
ncbi:unnamed protein product [Moneuplotes crassus]|uniref:Mitochondrial carrier protein n=1 Tax=Euplotes crassus TaxID=5936 RepID=A0AAD2CWV4_EUPCR|nr:unnamed protein product [Moneuplotes crassus]